MNFSVSAAARRWAGRLSCAALLCASGAHATGIDYTLTSLGGDLWRYQYQLSQTTGTPAFDEFTVYFELDQVQDIVSYAAPAGWDAAAAQPDPGLPDAGFFDVLHTAGPLAAGSVTGGFSVDFHVLAGTTPGAQRFDLVSSSPFAIVGSGVTVAAAVPEPTGVALMLAGLGVLGMSARRVRRRGEAAGFTGAAS